MIFLNLWYTRFWYTHFMKNFDIGKKIVGYTSRKYTYHFFNKFWFFKKFTIFVFLTWKSFVSLLAVLCRTTADNVVISKPHLTKYLYLAKIPNDKMKMLWAMGGRQWGQNDDSKKLLAIFARQQITIFMSQLAGWLWHNFKYRQTDRHMLHIQKNPSSYDDYNPIK